MPQQPSGRPDAHGSRTVTVEHTPEIEAGPSRPDDAGPSTQAVGVLKLRGGTSKKQRVVWEEGTIDNEGMGKRKSKICCIYNKPRAFDESSSESGSSDSEADEKRPASRPKNGSAALKKRDEGGADVEEQPSSDSDGGQGDGRARPPRKDKKKRHHHHHQHNPNCNHSTKPNKYDVQPSAKA